MREFELSHKNEDIIRKIVDAVKRVQRKRKIYDIHTEEFQLLARKYTGLNWDFSRLSDGSYRCCVENCWFGRLYGHWVCSEHLLVELKHFDPQGDDDSIFWSHIGKDARIKALAVGV